MKPENQVCSYEQADKLANLDVENYETLFVWGIGPNDILEIKRTFVDDYCSFLPAYTASELMEMLPQNIDDWWLKIEKNNGYGIAYFDENPSYNGERYLYGEESGNFTHILADCLIWLLENNHIKPEDLK
jgi:hypothetical protein